AGLSLEPVAAKEQGLPGAIRVVVGCLVAGVERDGPRGRISHRRRLGEDLLHPLVRRERLALLDSDRLVEAEPRRVERLRRLFLDDLGEQLPEPIIAWVDGVERFAR